MFRIIQPNTWYADPHGAPCKILRATDEVIHYNRNGRTCIASMGRFNPDFEPLTKHRLSGSPKKSKQQNT